MRKRPGPFAMPFNPCLFFAPSTLIPYPDGHDDRFQGGMLGLSLGW